MKLIFVKNGVELDDAKKLSDLHVQNDDKVKLCYKVEGTGMPLSGDSIGLCTYCLIDCGAPSNSSRSPTSSGFACKLCRTEISNS